ncbi:MAG: IS21-like element helper ATPase IstB [Rectinema sp.]
MATAETLTMKLQDLGLFTLSESLREKLSNPLFQGMDPLEMLECAIDDELDLRNNKLTERLLRRAKLKNTHASIDSVDYRAGRQLDKTFIDRLATRDFARNHRNVCFYGASGIGKSFLGKALGVETCRAGFRTLYVRFPPFMRELSRLEKGDSKKFESKLNYYGRIPVLLIDDWLSEAKKPGYGAILLDLMEHRYTETSTIFCTQLDPDGWELALDVKALAQSVMGRSISNSYILHIKGDDMRKYYNCKP